MLKIRLNALKNQAGDLQFQATVWHTQESPLNTNAIMLQEYISEAGEVVGEEGETDEAGEMERDIEDLSEKMHNLRSEGKRELGYDWEAI